MKSNKVAKLTIIFLAAVFTVLLLSSQANAFGYFVETINNTITKDDQAAFKLTIKNTLDTDDFFTISTNDVNWIVTFMPEDTTLGSREEKEFIVHLNPKQSLIEGRSYFVPIKITSIKTGFYFEERAKFAIYLIIPGFERGVYTPTVMPTVSLDKIVDPRQKVSVRINLWNRNQRDLNDLIVIINGQEFEQTYTTSLLPLEQKTNEILFGIDRAVAPGKRTVSIKLVFNNKTIADSSTEYEILGYSELKESSAKDISLFKTVESYSVVNEGNLKGTYERRFSIGLLERLFTKLSSESSKEKWTDGKSYYVVSQEITPQDSFTLTKTTNYRLLVTLILLLIIGVVLYFILRTPLILIKHAEPIGRTNEGLSEVKVRIYIRNRSRKQVSHIRITDVIPSIAEIEKNAHLGSMDPINISKGKRGTITKWEFDSLEPFEERIVAYKIKSKLKLVGGIRLPSAKIRFDTKKGGERVAHSNSVNLIHQPFEDE